MDSVASHGDLERRAGGAAPRATTGILYFGASRFARARLTPRVSSFGPGVEMIAKQFISMLDSGRTEPPSPHVTGGVCALMRTEEGGRPRGPLFVQPGGANGDDANPACEERLRCGVAVGGFAGSGALATTISRGSGAFVRCSAPKDGGYGLSRTVPSVSRRCDRGLRWRDPHEV